MTATVDTLSPFALFDPTHISLGAATAWVGPVGTALVADTVNLGDDWRTSVPAWSPFGATDAGWTYGFTPNTVDQNIEEQPNPAATPIDTLDVFAQAALVEDALANLRYAVGLGSIATQAAGVGAVAKSTWTLGTSLLQFALAIEHLNSYGHWTRVLMPIVSPAGQVAIARRRAAEKQMYAANFRCVSAPSTIKVIQKTGESTG